MSTDAALPAGFRVELDADARELRPGVWYGGQPARVLTLTGPGAQAWAELRDGPVHSRAAARLGARLTDAGLAHPVPPPPDPAPALTVVVPVHGRPAALQRCLAGLGRTHPVVVVDDASPDAAAVAAVVARHGATLVRLDVNAGPAAARNAGLAAVRTPLVAFVDSDTVPPPCWTTALVAHLADPLVAAAAPRVTPQAGTSVAGRYARARSSLDLGPRPAQVRPYTRVAYVPTAALVARVDALASVARDGAVFDEALRVGEDVDLVWRLHAAGWRVRYEPAVRVPHTEPGALRSLLARRLRYGTSAAPLAERHPGRLAPVLVHPWFTATAVALLARRPAPAAAAYAGAVGALARRLRRADVPLTGLLPATARGVAQTWLGLGRYATQFAAPVLVTALTRGPLGRRAAALSLLAGPAVRDWLGTDRTLDPVRYTALHVADDIAYGAGVLAGCARARTTVPLRPARADTDRRQ